MFYFVEIFQFRIGNDVPEQADGFQRVDHPLSGSHDGSLGSFHYKPAEGLYMEVKEAFFIIIDCSINGTGVFNIRHKHCYG